MTELSSPIQTIVLILDLFGTMAFAVTGAFKAIEHKADIVGIIILATITGVAGGTMRDMILGHFPPRSISDPNYVIITTVTGIVIFFLYPRMQKHWNLFLKFDALGLGVFTAIGATLAYQLFGMNFLAMAMAGMITAVGGGILRDMFVNEVPMVFVKELYASASFLGVVIFYILLIVQLQIEVATVGSILVTTILRLVAMKYNWNLPKVR
ncbi:MAG: trimeric intracellular cation channel family protein [Thaumarchaeota archaeon]|nr:trimeric intracellular cation channel family protein [Nitrososphaerota archaeon]MDE1841692.1 trimeric intracellular cation channel family protein [Nitrososphaerota archaeon]MDE1877933.1 trimeric intracellular cation channel family protein [Nitrososphaerota archaeon]